MFDETSLGSYLDYIQNQVLISPDTQGAAQCAAAIMSEAECFCFPIFVGGIPVMCHIGFMLVPNRVELLHQQT